MAARKRKSKSQKAKRQREQKAARRKQAPPAAPAPAPAAAAPPPENPTKSGASAAAFRRRQRQERVAQLIARGQLPIEEVAEVAGVCRDTVYEWLKEPEVAARVAQLQQRIKDKLETLLISQKFFRQLALQEQWLCLERIKEARAEQLNVPADQGGESGLLVRRLRMVGGGENAEMVEEFVFDAALAREVRETLKQAAQEAGQWVDKVAPTTPDGKDEYSGIPAPDLDDYRKLPISERIRLLRAPLRAHPLGRAEPPPAV